MVHVVELNDVAVDDRIKLTQPDYTPLTRLHVRHIEQEDKPGPGSIGRNPRPDRRRSHLRLTALKRQI